MSDERAAPTVGIIGLGYVGLSYAVAFAEAGCTVVGCDVLAARVATINRGESPLPDILPDAAVAAQVRGGPPLRDDRGRAARRLRRADYRRADARQRDL